MKIYLSPSNQTNNLYNDGRTECDVCFETAQILYKLLSDVGVDVYIAGKSDTLAQRITQSNKLKCDYHIPIHTNAGGGSGTRIFVYPKNVNNKMATSILKRVGDWSVGKPDKIVQNTTFAEIMKTNAVCIYVEGEFHDTNGDHIQPYEYAVAIYHGICDALGIIAEQTEEISSVNKNDGNGGKYYRVQIGAYKVRANAEKMCEAVRNAGFKAYIDYH